MRFLHDAAPPHDLTYDDVFMVPRHSAIASRYDVDLATDDGTGATLPLVVANMTAIAGKRMAETTARRGGLTVIPQDIPIPVVADVVAWVKKRHHVFDTAIELAPTQTVAEALALMPKRSHRAAVVVDAGRPVGVVTEHDCAEVDRFAQVGQVMNRQMVLVDHDSDPRAVFDALDAAKAALAVAVSPAGELVGVLTRLGALRATLYTPAVDATGGLRIAAAVGVNGDVAAQGGAPAGGGRRHPGRRHRPRPPGADDRGAQGDPCPRSERTDRGRQRRRREPAPMPSSTQAPTSSRSASGRARCARPG